MLFFQVNEKSGYFSSQVKTGAKCFISIINSILHPFVLSQNIKKGMYSKGSDLITLIILLLYPEHSYVKLAFFFKLQVCDWRVQWLLVWLGASAWFLIRVSTFTHHYFCTISTRQITCCYESSFDLLELVKESMDHAFRIAISILWTLKLYDSKMDFLGLFPFCFHSPVLPSLPPFLFPSFPLFFLPFPYNSWGFFSKIIWLVLKKYPPPNWILNLKLFEFLPRINVLHDLFGDWFCFCHTVFSRVDNEED